MWTAGAGLKSLRPAGRRPESLSSPLPVQNSVLCLYAPLSDAFRDTPKLRCLPPLEAQIGKIVKQVGPYPTHWLPSFLQPAVAPDGQRGKLLKWKQPRSGEQTFDQPCPQPHSINLCTRNYKRLHLVFLPLSGAGDQAWCTEYMGNCLATELEPQCSGEKLYLSPTTAVLPEHWEYFNWKTTED
jgi:hypothetical protein